ncbi:NAD(P)H-dependent FMN reductase [Herbihabitans rhizosphaerae]|uniref:NAD(P)H-dependent FMN reductase n=1 Tax=Herbihabitans rhizosphaerae TaxID=1872711 RepID=A0A4Q7L6Y9_9PSEU|nr:NAD(P)H-dependent oxidoreductase [Herbihabitans rhizosphaerae]RZS44381.1 NAD(P)H-dependent FMN reductase [Herbihabitans rhizosphaerae]
MPTLQIIVASTRPGRVGPTVAEWFAKRATDHGGFDVQVIDLAEVGLPFLDEPEHPSSGDYVHQHTKDWSATVSAADAFVFVMPEYNFGFTAPLKNAIDFLYREWHYKPVGFVSYGMGSAGIRAVQMLKQVVTTLRMVPLTDAVTVPLLQNMDGEVLRPNEKMENAATAMLDELAKLAGALAPLRV